MQIKKYIHEGNLTKIKLMNSKDFQDSNLLYYVVNNLNDKNQNIRNAQIEIIKYLVNDCKLESKTVLSRALDCDAYDVADYLYSKGFPIKLNNVSSAKALQWAFNHGAKCDKQAFFLITSVWNGTDNEGFSVYDRLLLLFKLYPDLETECKEEMNEFLIEKEQKEKEDAMPYECINCDQKCETDYLCNCCAKPLCSVCGIPNECINKTDWLLNLPNTCIKCNMIICGNCMCICHECANTGDTDNCTVCYTCTNCTKLTEINSVDCKYHKWNYCSKHFNVETPSVETSVERSVEKPNVCKICEANQNYHAKYAIF
jgi:hypothetical protein